MARAKPADAASKPDKPETAATAQAQPADAAVEVETTTESAAKAGKAADSPPQSIDVSFPPPAGLKPAAFEGAQLVVKATTSKGRWRVGRKFTREETLIPLADLSDDQQQALVDDPKIDVKLRLFQPA